MPEKDITHLVIASVFVVATVVLFVLFLWKARQLRRAFLDYRTAFGNDENRVKTLVNWLRIERWHHESSILSIPGDYARHTDGSYTAAFRIETGNTIYTDLTKVNGIYEKWAELVGRYAKEGYIVQIRDTKHLANGDKFRKHLQELPTSGVHPEARSLYLANTGELTSRFARAEVKESTQTLWIRVPTKHPADQSKESWRNYWRVFRENFSFSNFLLAWFKVYERKNNRIVRRLKTAEEKCRAEAEKIFRDFQNEAPQRLVRFKQQELKKVVYLAHVENAASVPSFVGHEHDLRPYFGAEKIQYSEDVIWHGNTPVAIVSLNRPPGVYTEVGIMRAINSNPTLRFRHTIVADLMPLDDAAALREINRAMKPLERQRKHAINKNKESAIDPRINSNLERLKTVKGSLGNPGARPVRGRLCVLVYGFPVKDNEAKETVKKYLDECCDQLIKTIRLMPGADGVRETGESLSVLYPRLMVGEMERVNYGYEILGESRDVLALAPIDGDFKGTEDGELWVVSATGELMPLTLYRPLGTQAPGAYIVAGSGGGKSFLVGTEIVCWLNYFAGGRVVVVDYGGSYSWLAKALNGKVYEFNNSRHAEVLSFNSWWYPGLEDGEEPDEKQIELVVREILRLSGIKEHDSRRTLAGGLLKRLVHRVYDEFTSQNRIVGMEKQEPTLSAFYRVLTAYDLTREVESVKNLVAEMTYSLEQWLRNPWIDAPTSPALKASSRFTIFELSSLDQFGDELKEVLAFRVAAFVMNTELNKVDGQFTNTLKIFDEMHENKRRFPMLADAIDVLARRERKSMGSILLASQNFKDLEKIEGVLTNCSVKIAGKQENPVLEAEEGRVTDFKALVNNMNLNDPSMQELKKIVNIEGEFAQFMVKIESGGGGTTSKFMHRVSPLLYWILSNSPSEINAKKRVEELTGDFWTYDQMFDYLANAHPFGLKGAKFDDTELVELRSRFEFMTEPDATAFPSFTSETAQIYLDSSPVQSSNGRRALTELLPKLLSE